MRALILIADTFEDCEVLYPYYRLIEQGWRVDLAGPKSGTVTGKHGYTIEASMGFADIKANKYDMLIIPGGRAPEIIRLDEDAIAVTRKMMAAGKPVGAVCHGAQVLVSANVLKGRKATCWRGVRDDVKVAGAKYSDEEVVVDGNLVTSRCPDDLPAFCRELLKLAMKRK
jgi:protease I